jgi:hypothetical protein
MELIVAIVVVSLITAATTMSISRALRAAEASELRERARARADLAASRIARDLAATVRDGDLYFVKLVIDSERRDGRPADELTVFAMPNAQARFEATGIGDPDAQSEGAEYEVAYRLAGPDDALGDAVGRVTRDQPPNALVLWRRLDPVPDEAWDGGGVVVPIVEGVTALSIEAYDGSQWFPTWDSDRDGIPHAVRVTTTAAARGQRDDVTASARRIVAIDRVPTPYVTLAPEERVEQANEAATAEQGDGGGS